MKRVRGACKGCKCSLLTEDGDYECAVKDGHLRKPPKVCSNRIDIATYMDDYETPPNGLTYTYAGDE